MDPIRMAGQGGPTTESYRFDDVVVDAGAHTLTRGGERQTVEPKAFAVLLLLLRRPGELIGRDELLDAVWGHRHVTPGVLTRVIAQLRHALGDDSQRPRYIQTQHALGYRFIAELHPAAEPRPPVEAPRDEGDAVAVRRSLPPETVAANEMPPPAEAVAAPPEPITEPVAAPIAAPIAVPAPSGRRLWWAVAGGVLLAALVALMFWWQGTANRPLPADPSIAVVPFVSLSDNRNDSYFAEGLSVEMQDALARVPGLKVVASSMLGSARVDDPVKLGKTLGVATVLEASVRRDGERMRINARLTDSRTGYTLWSGSYDRQMADVFALQSEIANEVVESVLGVLPANGQTLAKRLSPTRSVTAYDAYLKGLQQLRDGIGEQGWTNAIGFFRQALDADPAFARAQAGICRAEIQRFEAARNAETYERARTACLRASTMDPQLREVSLAMGEMYRVRGDSDKAIAQYTRALDDIALRTEAYTGIAMTEGARGRHAVALEYLERARELQPNDPGIQTSIGYQHYLSGDVGKAIGAYEKAVALQPADEGMWASLGGLYLLQGQTAKADEAFQRSLNIKPNQDALSNLGSLRYEAGRYADAARLYESATKLDPNDYRMWGNLADAVAAQQGATAQTRQYYQRAADLAVPYLQIKADDAQALAQLAWYRANLGERQQALDLLARAESKATEQGEVAFVGAQTMAVLGDDRGARERMSRARNQDVPDERLRSSPALRRLEKTGATP